MIAQDFLQDACVGEEPLALIASRRRELGGVAGALERDPEPVDLLLVGSLAQSLDEPRDTSELLLRERFEGNLLHTLGKARRKTKTRQYEPIVGALERIEKARAGTPPLLAQLLEKHR